MADDQNRGMNDFIDNIVTTERDRQRPTMEAIVATFDQIFAAMPQMGVVPDYNVRGPEVWSWIDNMAPKGLDKVYTVAMSAVIDGHPLLTIRQTISRKLDSNLVTSGLLIGKDPEALERALTNAVVQHSGAYSGLRSTLSVIVSDGLVAGLAHAMAIGGVHVTEDDITSGRAFEQATGEKPIKGVKKDSGDMN